MACENIIGKIYNGKYGPYVVTDYLGYNKAGKDRIYQIQFLNKNMFGYCTTRIVVFSQIIRIHIRDLYQPTIYGVACKGYAASSNNNGGNEKAYQVWFDMIRRCYDPNSTYYNNYGGIGISVYFPWRCYEYFLKDLPNLPGYNEWINNPKEYVLDKDILQQNIPEYQKIYSPWTCQFIRKRDNMLEALRRNNKITKTNYHGINKTKYDTYYLYLAIDNRYIGTLDSAEAAASLYNIIARNKGYPEEYLNKLDKEMSREEIKQHFTQSDRRYNKTMCIVLN